jgi:hypothetical protein
MSESAACGNLPTWRYSPGPSGGQDRSSIFVTKDLKLTSMQNHGLKSSRNHDITCSDHHISDIQKLGEDLNAATQAAWPRRHDIRYTNVQVLLLSWEDDDLGVSVEIEPLKRLFKERYYFGVEDYKIPSIKPDPAVTLRVLEFLGYDNKETLLILYYGGHARPALQSNEGSLWVA